MGLRYKKANVTHPTLNVTVQLPILGVKKNPSNPLYTQLGVLTKGTMYVRSIHPSPPGDPFLTMFAASRSTSPTSVLSRPRARLPGVATRRSQTTQR